MRLLTKKEIQTLASRPNIRQVAVENFLSTMGTDNIHAILNLKKDSELYMWNNETIEAIKYGIALAVNEITPADFGGTSLKQRLLIMLIAGLIAGLSIGFTLGVIVVSHLK